MCDTLAVVACVWAKRGALGAVSSARRWLGLHACTPAPLSLPGVAVSPWLRQPQRSQLGMGALLACLARVVFSFSPFSFLFVHLGEGALQKENSAGVRREWEGREGGCRWAAARGALEQLSGVLDERACAFGSHS